MRPRAMRGAIGRDAIRRDHVPERHLRPVGWNPFEPRLLTLRVCDLLPVLTWTMLGLLAGILVNKGADLVCRLVAGGMDGTPAHVACGMVAITAAMGLMRGLNGAMRLRHHNVIDAMRARTLSLIATSVDGEWYGPWMELRRTGGERFAAVEFRMDAIALGLDETLRNRHDEDGVRRAREAARVATRTIVLEEIRNLEDSTREIDGRVAVPDAVADFERFCARVADHGTAPGPVNGPTCEARAAALIEDAEDALSLRPDLVDRNGARIDDLVRIHLPRMMRIHQERLPGATEERRRTLDSRFDGFLELTKLSIEESFDIVQDERLDSCLTGIRFLRARRGEPEDPEGLSTRVGASRLDGPGMTVAV